MDQVFFISRQNITQNFSQPVWSLGARSRRQVAPEDINLVELGESVAGTSRNIGKSSSRQSASVRPRELHGGGIVPSPKERHESHSSPEVLNTTRNVRGKRRRKVKKRQPLEASKSKTRAKTTEEEAGHLDEATSSVIAFKPNHKQCLGSKPLRSMGQKGSQPEKEAPIHHPANHGPDSMDSWLSICPPPPCSPPQLLPPCSPSHLPSQSPPRHLPLKTSNQI